MLRGAKDDSYLLSLQREYGYLQVLHNLTDNDHFQWKFLRMRPFNFPTIRMAQLAALYGETPYWFQRIKSAEQPKDIFSLFEKNKGKSLLAKSFSICEGDKGTSRRFNGDFCLAHSYKCFYSGNV